MESGIDPGQDYYAQDYYNYDQGYDLPQYGSRRRLITPMYDEYGEVIMEDDGYYYSPHGPELGKKRIMLVLDREKENSSAGEESNTEIQRDRLPNSHSTINGNIYLAQNGTIIRTRRLPQPNNLKVGSPCRLGKQFKKLEKLGVTLEEPAPISSIESPGKDTENGVGVCVPANMDITNKQSSCGSMGRTITNLTSFGSKNNITKVSIDSNSSRSVNEEQETHVDNHKDGHTESHTEPPATDREELWMGPWNSLHIPMTKL